MIDAAPPVYLSCMIADQVVEITADEANQSGTVFYPKWRISNRGPAVFSPSRLIITVGAGAYEIDRVTLTITNSTQLPLMRSRPKTGTCSISEPPAGRKF